MKKSLFILALVISLNSYAQEFDLATYRSFEVGETVPGFELPGVDGESVSIANTDSKLIVLDFWASWCTPCLEAVDKTLKPIYASYDRRDVEIIGISNDRREDKWRAAIDKWELEWKNVWDSDQALVKGYNVPGIPTYFLVDGSGKVLASNVYSRNLKSEIRKALRNLN